MIHESLAHGVLIPIGGSFCFVGALLMFLFRGSSSAIRYREFFAQNLEAQGERIRSEKVKNETGRIRIQMPQGGRILIYIGSGLTVFSIARTLNQK